MYKGKYPLAYGSTRLRSHSTVIKMSITFMPVLGLHDPQFKDGWGCRPYLYYTTALTPSHTGTGRTRLVSNWPGARGLLDDVLTKGRVADSSIHDYIKGLRSTSKSGSSATLKAFFSNVEFWKNIYCSMQKTSREGDEHLGKRNRMVGYTLDEKDMSNLAGDKSEGFKWMWEPGNFLFTAEGEVYTFL